MHVTEFLMTHVTNKILNVGDIRSERRSHYGKKKSSSQAQAAS